MHMKLVHPVADWRKFECENCEKVNATKDIIEDGNNDKTSCNVLNETICEEVEISRDKSHPVEGIEITKGGYHSKKKKKL